MNMEDKITIQKENILKAYKQASKEQKILLENIFGKDVFRLKDIKDRVKTFEDAVSILGNDNQAVIDYYVIADKTCTEDILAFGKLKVIAEALNEGWKPTFKKDEYRYYPLFYIRTKEEYDKLNENERKLYYVYNNINIHSNFGYAVANTNIIANADSDVTSSRLFTNRNSQLAFKTRELAIYAGKQFIDIWVNFIFSINKKIKNISYKYFPKSKKELQDIILERIEKEGNKVDLNDIDTSKITDMSHLFENTNFNGDISNWNVSNVKNMNSIFASCKKFNSDISNWDVSNVTNMSYMFYGCNTFNKDISAWNVLNVTDMNDMFYNCKSFNQDISSWNVSNVTNMRYMFWKCKSFNQDISKWDVSNVKGKLFIFDNCPIKEKYKPKFK